MSADGPREPFDLRTTRNALVRAAGRQLGRWNARHPWDHNAHFHRWVLAGVPAGARRVLDVGSGRGDLARALRGVAAEVEGIDPDARMAYAAASALRDLDGVHIARRTLAEHAADPSRHGAYDAVSMIASLHHQDPVAAFAQARALLRPGGRLLVVSLVRPVGPVDRIWDLANVLTNPLIGLVKHPRPVRALPPVDAAGPGRREDAMPITDAAFSTAELRELAHEHLPGARVRRRTGFRVTLRWTAPVEQDAR